MGRSLSPIGQERFLREIQEHSPEQLSGQSLSALLVHYQELVRWNPRLSLVGPSAADDLLGRHFGESLAALRLLKKGALETEASATRSQSAGFEVGGSGKALQMVDIGSGGGFPGLVLAAARSDLRVTLIEPRAKKAAFLQSVTRKSALPCQCLNARVSRSLPEGLPPEIDIITMRALRLPEEALEAITSRLSPRGQLLIWQTEPFLVPPPGLAPGRTLRLQNSERRYIAEYVPRSSNE